MRAGVRRVVVLLAWAGVVFGWVWYQRSTGLGAVGSLQSFIDSARGKQWALVAFVVVYAIRPVVLFPATLMTIAGGLLFGATWGIVATVLGANSSAMVAYWIGRSFGPERVADPSSDGLLARWSDKMRSNSFETVMLMRLAFLPYDFVNYSAGLLRIRAMPFLLATAIGSIPGTVSFTLAGASIESLEEGPSGVDPRVFAVAVALFIGSVGVSRYVKKKTTRGEQRSYQKQRS